MMSTIISQAYFSGGAEPLKFILTWCTLLCGSMKELAASLQCGWYCCPSCRRQVSPSCFAALWWAHCGLSESLAQLNTAVYTCSTIHMIFIELFVMAVDMNLYVSCGLYRAYVVFVNFFSKLCLSCEWQCIGLSGLHLMTRPIQYVQIRSFQLFHSNGFLLTDMQICSHI